MISIKEAKNIVNESNKGSIKLRNKVLYKIEKGISKTAKRGITKYYYTPFFDSRRKAKAMIEAEKILKANGFDTFFSVKNCVLIVQW